MTDTQGPPKGQPYDTAREDTAAAESAEEEAIAALVEEAREAAGRWYLDDKSEEVADVASLAYALDPDNAREWLRLANEVGPKPALALLRSGRRGVMGLDTAKKAAESTLRQAAAEHEWHKVDWGARPTTKERKPLFVVPKNDGTGETGHYLPGGIVGLVVATGGTGKTTWLAELAMRVAFGDEDDADQASVPPLVAGENGHGPVMILFAEEDHEGASSVVLRGLRRVVGHRCEELAASSQWPERVSWRGGADSSTALGQLVTMADPVRGQVTQVVPTPLHDALCNRAREVGPLLVVLDPLNQLLPIGASENDAVAAGAVITLAGQIRAAAEEGLRTRIEKDGTRWDEYRGPRPVVLLAHHENQAAQKDENAGASAARGSTAFVDNARWMLRMRRIRRSEEEREAGIRDAMTFKGEKSNYTRLWSHTGAIDEGGRGLVMTLWTTEDEEALARYKETKREANAPDRPKKKSAVELAKEAGGLGIASRKLAEKCEGGAGAVNEAISKGTLRELDRGKGRSTIYHRDHAPADATGADELED